MRHLKTYESFYDRIESDLESGKYRKRQEHLRVLEDMSLELWDDNFNIQLGSIYSPPDENYMKVTFQKRGCVNFNYDDIKDSLLSMVSYMESEGYSIKSIEVSNKYTHDLIDVELKEDELYLKDKVSRIDGSYMVNYPIGQLVIKFQE